jgi:hypothetical protein
MRMIQLIKTFDQTDIKQDDPADDEEDQNLWEAWINFLNELEKSRRFANFVKMLEIGQYFETRCVLDL